MLFCDAKQHFFIVIFVLLYYYIDGVYYEKNILYNNNYNDNRSVIRICRSTKCVAHC